MVLVCVVGVHPAWAADITIGGKIEQGGLLIGTAPANAQVTLGTRKVPVGADGRFIVGFDQDRGGQGGTHDHGAMGKRPMCVNSPSPSASGRSNGSTACRSNW